MKKSSNSYNQTSIGYDNITFDIEYDYYPSEPMVMHYGDGSGYPGCGAEVEIHSIKIGEFEVYDVIYESVIDSLIDLIIETHEG
jgi:hypothetical protein